MPSKILLVEDEENLLRALQLNLELEQYAVVSVNNGKDALTLARKEKPDLIILDVMLPELDGFTVAETLRREKNNVSILFLTAKSTPNDKVLGLKIGGDDYLTKPFNLEELLLRVKNLLKRTLLTENEFTIEYYKFGNNEVNFSTFETIDCKGKKRLLNKREIELLKILIARKNKVVSRDEILDLLWSDDNLPTSRTIDNYILAFRKYFEPRPRNPRHFHSIRGIGYKFTD